MADHPRRAEIPAHAHAGSGGPVLMGSAIGVAAAIAFGVFLWLAVH